MGTRPERIKEALRREASLIIQNDIKDPRLGFTTITRAEISKDLKAATIYYTVLDEGQINNTRHALASAAGFIRGLIADRLKMRFVPEINFKLDKSMEHGRRVYDILDKIKEERREQDGEDDRGDKKIQ